MSESVREAVDFISIRHETKFRGRFDGLITPGLLDRIENATTSVSGEAWSWSTVASPILDHIERFK